MKEAANEAALLSLMGQGDRLIVFATQERVGQRLPQDVYRPRRYRIALALPVFDLSFLVRDTINDERGFHTHALPATRQLSPPE
jgi:hypothetical protein